MGKPGLLEVVDVSKSFPGVKALDRVSLTLARGSVHALCGENGAGKSTLMNILIGMYPKDSGQIFFKGREVNFDMPKQALNAGISMIEQELSPIYEMTVAENIFLGREPVRSGFINYTLLNQKAKEILSELDAQIDPGKKMKELSLAQIQLVEIARAISYDSDVIIMDEPTSAIGEAEVEKLFEVIRIMKEKGKGILYISHRLKEVFTIADEVTVLRDGKHIATKQIGEIDSKLLTNLMVGRAVDEKYQKEEGLCSDQLLLSVQGLTKKDKLNDVSFQLKKGEVLGIFGLMGSGRTELFHAILGDMPCDKGEFFIEGQRVKIRSPQDAIRHGIGIVPEDRKKIGLNLIATVKDNITISVLRRFVSWLFINRKQEEIEASEIIRKLGVKTPSMYHQVKNLSGGNQQKVVIGRCILTAPQILLLDEPTRGIDVGAKREIYNFIADYVSQGHGVIMVSSELPEILGLSDRIILFRNGSIVGEFQRGEISEEELLRSAS